MMAILAQIKNPVLPPALGGGGGKQGGEALGGLISGLVGVLFIAGFLFTLIQLLIGGINWISAGGEKQKLEEARSKITNAFIGMMIVAAAYAFTSLIARFFGLDLTTLTIPGIGQ